MLRGVFAVQHLKQLGIFYWDKYSINCLGLRIIIVEKRKMENDGEWFKRGGKIKFAKLLKGPSSNRTKILKTTFKCIFIKKDRTQTQLVNPTHLLLSRFAGSSTATEVWGPGPKCHQTVYLFHSLQQKKGNDTFYFTCALS